MAQQGAGQQWQQLQEGAAAQPPLQLQLQLQQPLALESLRPRSVRALEPMRPGSWLRWQPALMTSAWSLQMTLALCSCGAECLRLCLLALSLPQRPALQSCRLQAEAVAPAAA